MNRQALRSVYTQSRPELYQIGHAVKNYFRVFSTSQSHAAENDASSTPSTPNPERPSIRQRTRAATSEISSIARGRGGSAAPGQRAPSPAGQPTGPKVLDVRSLPRGGLSRGRGGGGLRGRGGFTGTARGGSNNASSPGGANRFSRGGRGAPAATGRVARGGRGRGGARGRGRGRGGKKDGVKKDDEKNAKPWERKDPFDQMDAAEKEFDDALRFGTRTTYTPSLDLKSLQEFIPAIATSNSDARIATIVQNLRTLGGGDPVGTPLRVQASNLAQDLERNGLRFFADAESLQAAEEYLQAKRQQGEAAETEPSKAAEPIITAAEESIRKVITERALEGQYEAPKSATEPIGISRLLHLKSESYGPEKVAAFEQKLSSLLSSSRVAKAAQAEKPKAEKPQTKAEKPQAKAKAKA